MAIEDLQLISEKMVISSHEMQHILCHAIRVRLFERSPRIADIKDGYLNKNYMVVPPVGRMDDDSRLPLLSQHSDDNLFSQFPFPQNMKTYCFLVSERLRY
jgi:hypothetical protein